MLKQLIDVKNNGTFVLQHAGKGTDCPADSTSAGTASTSSRIHTRNELLYKSREKSLVAM